MVPYQAGLHRFVYPLKARGNAVSRTLKDFTISVQLNTKSPLKNVYSPTHKISVARKNDRKAIIGFEKDKALLNRDFVLYYSVSPKDLGLNLLTHRIQGQDGYFMMMATPKTSYSSKELVGKNITFVLDTSGSMSGPKMKWARVALEACLKKLNPKDHFNVIRFSTDVEALFTSLQPANTKKVKEAVTFIKKMQAAGGTAIDEALKKALSQKPKGNGVNIVVFLTDGHPTIGETEPSLILKNTKKLNTKGKTRIFTFGIGTSINTKLLDKIAHSSGATGDYVQPNKEIQSKIDYFYNKVRYPVFTDIGLKLTQSMRFYDIYPKQIPDLFRGGQVLLFGRYRGKGHTAIGLHGKIAGKAKKFVYETKMPSKHGQNGFIARLWANRKVAYLLENIRLHGEKAELKNEVIRLGKKFGIVTPYTAYLVVEAKDRWRLADKGKKGNRPLIQQNTRTMGRRGLDSESAPRRMRLAKRRGRSAPAKRRAAPRREEPSSWLKPMGGGAALPSAPSTKDMASESGAKAVKTSRFIRKMKKEKTVHRGVGTRFVKGKIFVWKNGYWTDRAYKTSMKPLHVKYMSKFYFRLLRIKPALGPYFALGNRIILALDSKYALIIGPKEKVLKDAVLKKYLKVSKVKGFIPTGMTLDPLEQTPAGEHPAPTSIAKGNSRQVLLAVAAAFGLLFLLLLLYMRHAGKSTSE